MPQAKQIFVELTVCFLSSLSFDSFAVAAIATSLCHEHTCRALLGSKVIHIRGWSI